MFWRILTIWAIALLSVSVVIACFYDWRVIPGLLTFGAMVLAFHPDFKGWQAMLLLAFIGVTSGLCLWSTPYPLMQAMGQLPFGLGVVCAIEGYGRLMGKRGKALRG